MPEIKIEYLLIFAGFVLPGAISIFLYRMKVPQRDIQPKDQVLEAVCFSLLNFVLLIWLIQFLARPGFIINEPFFAWLIVVFSFVLMPSVWPFLLAWLLRVVERKDWVGVRSRTAWDDFFGNLRRGCWVKASLSDGSVVGGKFDLKSFASANPDPGHLYIEELWVIDNEGRFVVPVDGRPGIILRPSDYKHVYVYRSSENE